MVARFRISEALLNKLDIQVTMWCFPIILIPPYILNGPHPLEKLSTALWRLILSDTALCHPRTAAVALRFKWLGLLPLVHCSECHIQFIIRTNCPLAQRVLLICFEVSIHKSGVHYVSTRNDKIFISIIYSPPWTLLQCSYPSQITNNRSFSLSWTQIPSLVA